MTTVVIADNKVFCDSQATAGSMITDYNVQKALNLGSCIVVGAGRWSHVLKFQEWVAECLMAQAAQQDHPYVNIQMPEEMVDDDFMGAILHQDGVVELFEGCKDSYETPQPVFLGSGGCFAAGAIKAGADGVDAIKAAIELDPYSGGEVKVEDFSSVKKQVSKEELLSMSKEDILATLYPEEQSSPQETSPQQYTVSEEDAARLEDVVAQLTQMEDDQSITVLDAEGNIFGELFYRYDEEDELVELEFLNDADELVVISNYALQDYDQATLYRMCKRLGISAVHNTGKVKLIDKVVAYFEELV